ncbi:hemerythrin domain-containing protein [Leptospira sp. 201903070]|uniref:Hemerythrin domain-containing protein n=1 Tax=Leptospira ainlahdjerensis TaxID=2810033 RepID=A0ABS2UD56_9LEPT|nr:hemerythrin domain-containing protein [Leptospira ainlahdjerensis]MBM9578294.1 hemerythrin domain-containing protein [Leptospira ainlahdjerensis]
MELIGKLKRQHQIVNEYTRQIESEIDKANPNIGHLVELLSVFSASLLFHLNVEDMDLYLRMEHYRHNSPTLVSLFEQYRKTMFGLKDTLLDYASKYSDPLTIEMNFSNFKEETIEILNDSRKRIDREESEFYPLIEEILRKISLEQEITK